MTAKRRWTNEEKAKIIELYRAGMTYKEIGAIIRPSQQTAWRKIGDICREYKEQEDLRSKEQKINEATDIPSNHSALVAMPRDERVGYLMAKLHSSARGRAIMAALNQDQKALFAEMYHEIIDEFDSLTSAEDQMLMQAILAYAQYTYAAQMASRGEQAFIDKMDGVLDEDDPAGQLAGVADRYKREMELKHKEYVNLMDKLKATRDQRLKSVVDQRKTFGELQREFLTSKKRKSIIKEILALDRMTDEELKRLLEGGVGSDGESHPWLIGDFG